MPARRKRQRTKKEYMPESDGDEDYVPPVATRRRKKAKTTDEKQRAPHSSRGFSEDLKRLLKQGLICVGQRCFKNIRQQGGAVRLNLKVNGNEDIALESGSSDHVNSDLINVVMKKHLGAKSTSRCSIYETLRMLYRSVEFPDLTKDFGLHEISREKLVGYQPDIYCGSNEDKEYAREQLKRFFEDLNCNDTHIGPNPQQLARYNLITGTLNELPPSDFEIACAKQRAEQSEFDDVNRALDQWEKDYMQKFEIEENEVIYIDNKVNAVLALPDDCEDQQQQQYEEEEEFTDADSEKLNQVLAAPDNDENTEYEEEEEEEEGGKNQRKLNETLQMPDLFNDVEVPVVKLSADCEAAFLQ